MLPCGAGVMKLSWVCVLKLLLISFLISSLLHASPGVKSSSPARGISVPVFNNLGIKMYEISGSTGTLDENGVLIIENVILDSFDNAADSEKKWEISSNSANVLRSQRLVQGNGPVFMDGGNFTAVATDWKFFYDEKKFVADKNIKVLFEEDAVEFLVP